MQDLPTKVLGAGWIKVLDQPLKVLNAKYNKVLICTTQTMLFASHFIISKTCRMLVACINCIDNNILTPQISD